jgi:hypothetical protein
MTAFLLAWKETGWPYEDIVRMITILDEQGFVDEPWRIAAHNMASSPMEPMIVAPYLIRRLSSTSWSRSCAEPIPTQGSRSFPAGGSLNAVSVG